MWEWSDKLKLGKSSAFVKRDIRSLPQTAAEFEADFFLDPTFSTEDEQAWRGTVVEREHGTMLAFERVAFPPPTVNSLATVLAHAMLLPPSYEDRQRPSTIRLRDRPQWQELLPHLRQLGIKVILGDDLPRFDEAVIEWMQEMKKPPSPDQIKATLRKPFPERKRTWFTDAMALMQWSDAMSKGAYPSRKAPAPLYDPTTTVSIHLAADELEPILTRTDIANTKKLRPRLEAMAAAGESIELNITDWSCVVLSLCGAKGGKQWSLKQLLRLATRIANQLAEALNIEPPNFSLK